MPSVEIVSIRDRTIAPADPPPEREICPASTSRFLALLNVTGLTVRCTLNVFADISLAQPEQVLAKARIVETIADLIGHQKMSQQEAGNLFD